MARRLAAAFSPERFFVTIGGMHALEIAARLTVGPGEEALIPSPAWPNFAGAARSPARAPSSCRSSAAPSAGASIPSGSPPP